MRVVEVSRTIAGALSGMLLADYGADVVVVEPPDTHPLRSDGSFEVYGRGKHSVVADLETEGGRRRVRELIAGADVAIVEATPEVAEGAGIDYPAVRRTELVYVALTPFGQRGPLSALEGDEHVVAAFAGLMAQQESLDGNPVFVTIPMVTTAAGLLVAGGVAAALRQRALTGHGQRVATSLLAGALALAPDSMTSVDGTFGVFAQPVDQAPEMQGKIAIGRRWKVGDPLGGMPVFRLYRASDGYLALACGGDYFWHRLCVFLEHPEWIGDTRFENAPWGIPQVHRDWLVGQLTAIFARRTRGEWLAELRAADIPAAPVEDREAFMRSSRVVANGLRVMVAGRDGLEAVQGGPPIAFERSPAHVRGPAPEPGEHEVWPERPREEAAGAPPTGMALAGVRVIDLTTWVGGSYGPGLLADLGADVVKVESPDGDPMRAVAIGYMGINRGKRSIVLDLKTADGRDVLYRLVRDADVVTQNFRPGVAERLGIDYATVRAINPRIVYSAMSAHGSKGEHAKEPGFDILFQALSGAVRAQGGDGKPVYLTNTFVDFVGGLSGFFGVVAALYDRECTGDGQYLESSLLAAAMVSQLGAYGTGPAAQRRGGADYRGPSAEYRLYQSGGQWTFVDARRDPGVLRRVLEISTVSPSTVGSAVAQRAVADVVAGLVEAGAVAVALNDWVGLAGHPQIVANGLEERHEHPVWGPVVQVGPALRFGLTPAEIVRPSPMLGEHTREVLSAVGLAEAAIDDLLARGVAVQGSVERERARIGAL